NSISHARHFENQNLRFMIHDMRDPLTERYNVIFNLFTSFGYFDREETNARVLRNFKLGLHENGHVVIDFLNLAKVRAELIPSQKLVKQEVEYKINKSITDQFIIKDIEVTDGENQFKFQEKVQALDLEKFERYSAEAGLKIVKTFGDYSLNDFSETLSDRLILVLQ
ncbi:MAG: SAM-dependent methyltransferase, partial [Lutimonas sp.]